jgi:uncharacterized protein (TIGR02246 family)
VTDRAARDAVDERIAHFHAAFAAGDAARFAESFATDGRLFLLHREPLEGREAIRDHFTETFAQFDTSAWEPTTELVELHEPHAHAFGTYTERLLKREDGSRQLVRGRLVHFLRRDEDGSWWITLAMNSHSRPVEPIP